MNRYQQRRPDDPNEGRHAAMGLPPWHMWGSSYILQSSVAGIATASTPQLVRINYGRPECWRFLAHVACPAGTPAGASATINFKAIMGIGRCSVTLSPLAQFVIGASIVIGASSWQTRSFQPNFDGTLTTTNPDDQMVAQDIQGWAELSLNSQATNVPFQVSLMFGPNVHIRSDWYKGIFEENFEE